MDNRSFQSGAIATPPSAPASPSIGYPTNGDPGGTPATLPGEFWFHQVGEELRSVIAAAGFTPSGSDLTQLLSALKIVTGPTGSVIFFAGSEAPSGYLKANGALYSRTAYAALFAAIGIEFGAGDGSTTFAVPDLRGEFLRGFDDGRGVDSGRVFGAAQADAFKSHDHGSGRLYIGGTSGNAFSQGYTNGTPGGLDIGTSFAGGTETRPRNIALLACIKY